MSDYLIPWVGRYFHCDSGHVGIERPTEECLQQCMPWDSVSTEGLVEEGKDAQGYVRYTCKTCEMPMLGSCPYRLAEAGLLKQKDLQRATLPSVGDRIWHVFHGAVRSGLVSKVTRPVDPLKGYAAVFVTEAGGTCCVHGANPAIVADTDHWYWAEATAQAVVDAEAALVQRRREIAARSAAAV